jgi:hypothetical protein
MVLASMVTTCALAKPAVPGPASAATQEYDLKAVFLFHFAEFVDWPSSTFGTAGAPITIAILGDDPFGRTLDQIVANETVKGRKLLVRRYERPDQVDSCQIVFISRSERGRMNRIMTRLARPGLLTVGDVSDFAKRQGIIGFITSGDRLRLRINVGAARAAGLTISSKLLRQAEVVASESARR